MTSNENEISTLLEMLLDLQSQKQFCRINEMMVGADMAHMSPVMLIGLARFNFPYRSFLPEWDTYVKKVEAELRNRNIQEIDNLLQGLQ